MEIQRVPTHTSLGTSPTSIRTSIAWISAPLRLPSTSAATRGLHLAHLLWGAARSRAKPLLPLACVVPGMRSSPWSSAYHLDPRRCVRLDPPPQPISLCRRAHGGTSRRPAEPELHPCIVALDQEEKSFFFEQETKWGTR